jgi:hypothetical protein
VVQAADRFHCPPWELLGRGKAWVELALLTVNAEREGEMAQRRRAERQQRLARAKGG